MEKQQIKGIKLQCPNIVCGYRWCYTGKLLMASCPCCNAKVKTGIKRSPPIYSGVDWGNEKDV